jgi:hypothetical protein
MLKKTLAAALVVCTVPALANAWFLTTQAQSKGGSITTRNATAQTVAAGNVFKSYTSASAFTGSISAVTGYSIKSYTVNGTPVTPAAGTTSVPTIALGAVKADKSLTALFVADGYGLTATFPNGNVTPTKVGGITENTKLLKDLVFTFSPKSGYTISNITGVTPVAGEIEIAGLPATVNSQVTVTFKKNYVFHGGFALSATSASTTPTLNPILPKTAAPGAAVALAAVTSNIATPVYTWKYISGPANTVSVTTDVDGKVVTTQVPGPAIAPTVSGANYSFTAPTAEGQYVFQVTVPNGAKTLSSVAVVNVKTGQTSTASCQACHTANSVADATLASRYAVSAHGTGAHFPTNACAACHVGTDAGGHPGTVTTSTMSKDNYITTIANVNGSTLPQGGLFCITCHVDHSYGKYSPPHTADATSPACQACHSATGKGDAHDLVGSGITVDTSCSRCHTVTADALRPLGSFVDSTATAVGKKANDCIGCHDIADIAGATSLKHPGKGFVNDNNGVRAVIPEFGKRSHHILSGTLHNEQCVVCHLEGKAAADGSVVVDGAFHMKGDAIYLRNADTDAAFVWTGSEHTAMDNFCFSCHDTDGATSAGIKAFMAPGTPSVAKNFGAPFSAKNPFADTLTNSYDQVARAGVVDVKTAFTTTNASHHAVSGQRYKYRFSNAANAAAWAAANPTKPAPTAAEIAVGNNDLDGNPILASAFDSTAQETVGLNDKTLYEAEKFVSTYIPLGASQNVADNSVLHCGDCHTVGQWKAESSTNADGSKTPVAIGAHGSANDYLLRNSLGTDALHSSQTYVCFNCHISGEVKTADDGLWAALVADGEINSSVVKPTWNAGWNKLHPNVIAGQVEGGYVTAHAVSAFHAQCQADSSAMVGTDYPAAAGTVTPSRITYSTGGGHKDRTLDFVPAANATATIPGANAYSWVGQNSSSAAGGNITGIACTNCHNSGLRTSWGGIHGGNSTYTDGLGRTQKTYRFMPGMGNYRYAPPGGWNGKDKTDATLVTQAGAGVGAGKPMGGCYTNGTSASGDLNPAGFSACNHHGTSTAQTTAGGQAAGFRTTYGGGTTATPTAAEPTVREATAGGTLVTRPLKY